MIVRSMIYEQCRLSDTWGCGLLTRTRPGRDAPPVSVPDVGLLLKRLTPVSDLLLRFVPHLDKAVMEHVCELV